MLTLKQQDIENIRNEVLKAKGLMEYENYSYVSINAQLAHYYESQVADVTYEDGLKVVSEIMAGVDNFNNILQESTDDLDAFIDKFQDNFDEDKTCKQKCQYWYQIIQALTLATNAMEGNDIVLTDDIINRIDNMSIAEDQISEEMAEELRIQAKEAIKSSGIYLTSFISKVKDLEKYDNAQDCVKVLLLRGNNEVKQKAFGSMIAYVYIKNNYLEDFENITPADVSTMICVDYEQYRISHALENGELAIEIAATIIAGLGVITMFVMILAGAGMVLAYLVTQFYSLLTAIIGIVAFVALCYEAYTIFDKFHIYDSATDQIAKAIYVPLHYLLVGFSNIADYIKNLILPEKMCQSQNIYEQIEAYIKDEMKDEDIVFS